MVLGRSFVFFFFLERVMHREVSCDSLFLIPFTLLNMIPQCICTFYFEFYTLNQNDSQDYCNFTRTITRLQNKEKNDDCQELSF